MRNNPKVKLSGDHNECAGCGELFNSTAAFEKHRTGSFGFHGKGVTRRCRAPDEMLAKGMAKNAGGWWITAEAPQRWLEAAQAAGGINLPTTPENGSTAP